MKLLPFDEIDILKATLESKEKIDTKETIDAVLELLVLAYINGVSDTNDSLGTGIKADTDLFIDSAYRKYDGKDFEDRIKEYAPEHNIADIMRVVETDTHRVYNAGAFDTAERSGLNVLKRWNTKLDDKVRDEHQYMEGQTVPLDALFYSYDGHSTKYPGGFGIPELDINCRCYLTYEQE